MLGLSELQFQLAEFWLWLDVDISGPTLFKSTILGLVVFGFLLAIGALYRGDLQNRDIEASIKQSDGVDAEDEIIFAKRTLDVKAPRSACKIAILLTDLRTYVRTSAGGGRSRSAWRARSSSSVGTELLAPAGGCIVFT